MERKIGEIFEYNGEWYQCLEEKYCNGCVFRDTKCDDVRKILGNCSVRNRSDKKSVIFKKLEKVGEPYKYFVQHEGIVMLQPYNLFATPIINGVVCNVHYDTNTIDLEIKQTKEDMGEKKLNLKPFDIQKAREGKPVCTRDGRKARIICFDYCGTSEYFSIIALVKYHDSNNMPCECIIRYTKDGKCDKHGSPHKHDLMMLPEKKEGWVNIYKSDNGTYYTGAIFYEKNDALVNTAEIEITTGIARDCIDTVKIEWEE